MHVGSLFVALTHVSKRRGVPAAHQAEDAVGRRLHRGKEPAVNCTERPGDQRTAGAGVGSRHWAALVWGGLQTPPALPVPLLSFFFSSDLLPVSKHSFTTYYCVTALETGKKENTVKKITPKMSTEVRSPRQSCKPFAVANSLNPHNNPPK